MDMGKFNGRFLMTGAKLAIRSFSSDIDRRAHIDSFNKIIVYGLPRISYLIHPARDPGRNLSPVFIAHGMFGSKSNWNSLAKSICRTTGRQVITYDARNHGNSEHHVSMSYAAMTHDLLHLIEKLKQDRCILIGHSMGGKTAMSVALTNPQKVEKLIVVDSSPTSSIAADAAWTCIRAMMDLDLTRINDKRVADEILSNEIKDTSVRQFLLTNLAQATTGYAWRINLQYFKMNFKDLIGFPKFECSQYTGPSLFVGGANSEYITKKEHPEICRLFPNAQIQHIENAGHWVHSDQPIKFVNSVAEFLNSE